MSVLAAGVLAALLLAGCATSEGYDKQTATWVGRNIDDLVVDWGPPNRSFQLAQDETIYEWTRVGSSSSGGYFPFGAFASFGHGFGSWGGHGSFSGLWLTLPVAAPVDSRRTYCSTRFIVDDAGIITSYSFEGDDCVAQEP